MPITPFRKAIDPMMDQKPSGIKAGPASQEHTARQATLVQERPARTNTESPESSAISSNWWSDYKKQVQQEEQSIAEIKAREKARGEAKCATSKACTDPEAFKTELETALRHAEYVRAMNRYVDPAHVRTEECFIAPSIQKLLDDYRPFFKNVKADMEHQYHTRIWSIDELVDYGPRPQTLQCMYRVADRLDLSYGHVRRLIDTLAGVDCMLENLLDDKEEARA